MMMSKRDQKHRCRRGEGLHGGITQRIDTDMKSHCIFIHHFTQILDVFNLKYLVKYLLMMILNFM